MAALLLLSEQSKQSVTPWALQRRPEEGGRTGGTKGPKLLLVLMLVLLLVLLLLL